MSQLKAISVKLAGRGDKSEAERVILNPGSTVEDVLKQMNIPDYQLSFNGRFLDKKENLYDLLSEGSSLSASPDLPVAE